MKRRRHFLWAGLLSLCMMLQMAAFESMAAGREAYTYTVTFYPGNHGSFAGTEHVTVDNSKTGSAYQVTGGGASITVSGLRFHDVVSFDAAMAGAVALGENSKYYVKGIRQSGRDNDTVGLSAFQVKSDQDYVVAYGIRGELTSYVVNYQDASGRTLAPSRTYYGNVGDKPVVAFVYIEGYEPQAYNLTKTLVSNTAENVFTFVYSRTANRGGGTGGGGTGTTDTGTNAGGAAGEGGTGTAGGTAATGTGTAGTTGAGDGQQAGGGAAGAAAAQTGGAEAQGGPDADVQTVPDEEVPQDGPQELQELDDEDVPLFGGEESGEQTGVRMMSLSIILAVAAAAALLFLAVWMKKRRKEETKRTDTK